MACSECAKNRRRRAAEREAARIRAAGLHPTRDIHVEEPVPTEEELTQDA